MIADPIQDQFEAAAAEANRQFEEVTKQEGLIVADVNPVTKRVAGDFLDSIRSGRGRQCRHVTPGPMVVYAAAAIPGLVACLPCMQTLHVAHLTLDQADGNGRTCDGCKEKSEAGSTGLVRSGPLLIAVSLCVSCTGMGRF